MDYYIFSSNRSILQSSAIHPIIATADKSGHFVPVGVTSAFDFSYISSAQKDFSHLQIHISNSQTYIST